MNELALPPRIMDIIEEYNAKRASIPAAVSVFQQAGVDLMSAATVSGTYGNTRIDVGTVYERCLEESLLKSAWYHIYNGLSLKRIATAKDKKLFEQAMASPPEFTIDNIRASFGDYVVDPRGNILRGLAEVFCDLDPAYKSHDKVKIGVAGLPKRIIMSGFSKYSSYGRDKTQDILNALASFQEKPMVEYRELYDFCENAEKQGEAEWPERGISLKVFKNGNGHLIFMPDTLRDINLALAEYYGDVLADCSDDDDQPKRQSTAVSKDLQYYPTPVDVVARVVSDIYMKKGAKVLEPSCGCGRFMDALRKEGAKVIGFEVDSGRAAIARAKGHHVMTANFLETVPTGDFDFVVMNPPFYGRHYAKHIEHALKFLKPEGVLTAILPITARYDHGLMDKYMTSRHRDYWKDLPVGSFRESGTNINTTVLTIRKPA